MTGGQAPVQINTQLIEESTLSPGRKLGSWETEHGAGTF